MKAVDLLTPSGRKLEVRVTETSAERRTGYLDQTLPPSWGLLISGAPIIHTFGMSFPIDLLWIRQGQIIKVTESLNPKRLAAAWAWNCLELPAGWSRELGLGPGRGLHWIQK